MSGPKVGAGSINFSALDSVGEKVEGGERPGQPQSGAAVAALPPQPALKRGQRREGPKNTTPTIDLLPCE